MFAWANSKLALRDARAAPGRPVVPVPLVPRQPRRALGTRVPFRPVLRRLRPFEASWRVRRPRAASYGSLNVLREILGRGVREDFCDHAGMGALHHASSSASMSPNEALETAAQVRPAGWDVYSKSGHDVRVAGRGP